MSPDDTIVAISSAASPAARVIVRASGSRAVAAARSLSSDVPVEPNAVSRTTLRFAGVDCPAWVYVFRAPRSYTGEDLVEFHLPGSPILAGILLSHLLQAGLRSAEPGEFTARAYFNGRLDLTEAEGVAAAVSAASERELSAARRLLEGELSRRIAGPMENVAETLALVEVGIDFTDEDVTFLDNADLRSRMESVRRDLAGLLADAGRLEELSHEPAFVLIGPPNAGKSTLFNALAGRGRAVTSPVAGTTRDVLSAGVTLRRGVVRLLDVAGLEDDVPADASDSAGDIRRQMRERARRAAAEADHVVLVTAADTPATWTPPIDLDRVPDVRVVTKIDLDNARVSDERDGVIRVSAHSGDGIGALQAGLDRLAFGEESSARLALNRRHRESIDRAIAGLSNVLAHESAPAEIQAAGLREVLDALGEIRGQVSPDDVLGRVFSRFCIGK